MSTTKETSAGVTGDRSVPGSTPAGRSVLEVTLDPGPAEPESTVEDPSPDPMADQPHETVITTKGFSSWYGKFQALHELDLEIPRKQVTALIGPSGCGKSTFLRWINRMNDTISGAYSRGEMVLAGEDITSSQCDVVDLASIRSGVVGSLYYSAGTSIATSLHFPTEALYTLKF